MDQKDEGTENVDSAMDKTSGAASSTNQAIPPTNNLFERALASEFFVDRTEFIKTFLTKYGSPTQPLFITAPSTFGKSTIVSMLESFFQNQTGIDGQITNYEDTSNYGLFSATYDNGRSLNIMKDEQFVKDHMAKYPVVTINLAGLDGSSDRNLVESIGGLMQKISAKFEYTLNKPSPFTDQIKKFISVEFDTIVDENIRRNEILDSGFNLTHHLFTYFNQPCIVLVDEVDSLVEELLRHPMSAEEASKIILTLEQFMSRIFENNECVRASFLTGRMRFIPTNNILHMRFSKNEEIATSFGTSEEQARDIFDRCVRKGKLPFDFKELKKHYGGYRVENSDAEVFSTLSVIKSLESKEITCTWNSGTQEEWLIPAFRSDVLSPSDGFKTMGPNTMWLIHVLGNIKLLSFQLQSQIDVSFIMNLKKYLQHIQDKRISDPLSSSSERSFKQYLYELGYLTTKDERQSLNKEFRIPNEEVKRVLIQFTGIANGKDPDHVDAMVAGSVVTMNMVQDGSCPVS